MQLTHYEMSKKRVVMRTGKTSGYGAISLEMHLTGYTLDAIGQAQARALLEAHDMRPAHLRYWINPGPCFVGGTFTRHDRLPKEQLKAIADSLIAIAEKSIERQEEASNDG